MTLLEMLPTFHGSATYEQFLSAYDAAQCVCFKKHSDISNMSNTSNNISMGKKRKRRSPPPDDHTTFLKDMLNTFNSATSKDQASWCIENDEMMKSSALPSDFLSPSATKNGYGSFVLQDDSTKSVTNFTERHVAQSTLPLHLSTVETTDDKSESHTDIFVASPYWIFVGRNTAATKMVGRSEHTDDIEHDGTFHHQLAGCKTWKIRPTEELRSRCDDLDIALLDSYIHTVEEGDVFLINTRLWWHQTEIPGVVLGGKSPPSGGDSSDGQSGLSISFARDIYLNGRQPEDGGEEEYMSNVEGGMANALILKGTILLMEGDPPIGRSTKREKSNCELIEIENSDNDSDNDEEVQMALVPTRDIDEGEFFIIFDSDSTH